MSEYDRGTGYPSLPSVLANIEQLYDVLVDDAYGRFTPEVVRTVRSPDRETLVREAARAAGEAEDLLLCYFSGHGCLYTSEPAQGPGRLYLLPRAGGGPGAGTGAYGLGYAELRDLLCAGRAERVVLVLDCCYSGNALLEPLPEDRAFALLTSSRRFHGQSAGDGSGPTPFTAALLEVLRGGGDGEDERGPVTVEALAEPLRRRAERDAERARGEADSDPDDWHPELHTANEAGNTVLSQAVRLPRTSRARRLARTVRARRDRLWARARARPVRAAGALGGQSLAVPAGSARAADAERLIRFLTAEPGSQRRLLEAGFAPALREAYGAAEPDCAAAPRVVRRTEAQRVPEGAVRGLPPGYPEFLWCALQEARARPASPYYPAFSRELRQEVAQLLAGGGSLEGTAERLHQSLALALEGRLPP
ncbi:hypothetical protein GCM10009757_28230 [Streptomyces cheonanensis]|uniref:Caspase domain-containing protein n=1 Tax=Streptomyces cheonanensis TaxID=312720 RepID=A0ABN2V6H4_9ACTN